MRRVINGSKPANWLLYGDLLCISMDESFENPVWAVVEKHIDKQRIVKITLCDKANKISEAEFIAKMQELTNRKKRAFMAESQTFYVAFAPAMEVLQHKDHVPFREFLVYPEQDHMKEAEYINEIKSPPDWEIIFHKESLPDSTPRDESSSYSLLKDFERLRLSGSCKSKLDETQLAAVELALKNRLVLIQGPPGTGKSFVGVALVRLLLSMNVPQNHGPILVVTYKNHALDNFLKDCLAKVSSPDVKIVRVGTLPEDADYRLRKCLLYEVGRYWPERLYKQKRKLIGQLWAMQRQVGRAFEKLVFSSTFNADMFLEEASDGQIKSLLMDNKHETPDGAEVESLLRKKDQDHSSRTRLKELVEKALENWLPSQKNFDRFVGEEKVPHQELSPAGNAKQKNKDEQDQENPNDFRDPSVEEKERLLAVDKDITEEEDEEIVKDVVTDLKDPVSEATNLRPWERKLVCVDETKVRPYKNLLDAGKVWELEEREKVQLVYVFQSRYYTKASSEFLEVSSEYTQIHHQLKELRNQHDIEVMKKCHVIGMTVTGATMRANLLADIKPSVMIVEEAAEILEGQLVAVIPPSVQHLIMIGDHKQLKPVVHFHRLKKHHHLDLSMFERLVNCKIPYIQLGKQCRMRDEIADLLRELKIYSSLQTNHELIRKNAMPACVESSMYFWTHTVWETESRETTKRNFREAKEITEVAGTFCDKGGVLPKDITVLCSYRGQVQEIKKQFDASDVSALRDITITTIDSFQGQENDIILISLVRSNKEGKIGYLSSINRLCVAISRARCGLYLFGNHAHLAKASRKGWKVLSDFMWRKKCRGSKFPFCDKPKPDSYHKGHFEGSSPTMEKPISNVTIHANQANVSIGGDNSVNKITTPPGHSPSATTPPRNLEMSFPMSGKTPVHNPKSPTSLAGFPPPRIEGGDMDVTTSPSNVFGQATERESHGADVEHVGERQSESMEVVRAPTQVTPEAEKSLDWSEIENMKERPIQESENAKSSITGTPATDEEFVTVDKEARTPTQQTTEAEKSSLSLSEFENVKEKPFQESEKPESNIADTPAIAEELMTPAKEARTPTQETTEAEKPSLSLSEFENVKEKPFQESEDPKNNIADMPAMEDEFMKETPVQESEEQTEKQELKDYPERSVRHVYQEGDFKPLLTTEDPNKREETKVETEDQRDGSGEQPFQLQGAEAVETKQVKHGEEDYEVISEGKPLQESASSNKETESWKEEALPTQETPVQEGEEQTEKQELKDYPERSVRHVYQEGDFKPLLTTEDPNKREETKVETEDQRDGSGEQPFQLQGAEAVETKQVKHGEEDYEVISEGKPLQESASSNKETESWKEEALPTQETMAAGKGSFEETGKAQGPEAEETKQVEEGEELHEEITKGKTVQESASSDVKTESCKEEALPTQETMTTGEGPFEETWFEMGFKRQPTGGCTDEEE
ncbi:NFX1-type zinc finger-containing protein 1-like isoform X1 [Oculina patagonica]